MRRALLFVAVTAAIGAACPAAAAAQPSWSGVVTTSVAAGAQVAHYRDVTVPGENGTYHLVTVTWPLGDARYRIRTALPGGAPLAGGWLNRRGLAQWAASASSSAGLVAAISPDYGSYKPARAHTSGLLIRNGVILHIPSGVVPTPSVGYTMEDTMVFGTPRAVPLQLRVGDAALSVSTVEDPPADTGTVGLYRQAGEVVTVPSGYAAVALTVNPLAAALVQHPAIRSAGEPVIYTLHDAAAPRQTMSAGFQRVAGGDVAVPDDGAVLVMRSGGVADQAFAAVGIAGQVSVTQTDAAWQAARWVMGGKPLLVSAGVPIAQKPLTMTDYQWEAMTARAAVGRTAGGRGVLAILSTANRDQGGVSATGFASLLRSVGVTDAIGLDAGPVPELYSPRLRSTTCRPISSRFCYRATASEFPVPAATTVTFVP